MYLKLIASMAVITCVTLPAYAQSCAKNNRVFFCQTKENTQINLCKKGNQYLYEYGYIGYKPKQRFMIPLNKITREHYVIEGTRNVYSLEFNRNAVTYSMTANIPRNKADKMAAFANIIQSTNQGDNIIDMATCRMDTLKHIIKKDH